MEYAAYISIITVNYNGMEDTCQMIYSLKNYISAFPYEIIVVDNASSCDEASFIQTKFPDVKCIRSNKNLGFAGGNNLGISRAKGKYILLLNNDTYIENSTLSELTRLLELNPAIGAVSPKIKFSNSNIIQFAGYTALSRITLRNKLIGFGEVDSGQYDEACPTPFVHGAAMMIRRDIIEQIGLMPEIYFLYYEELDWCEQIKKSGFELWYDPQAEVYHKESHTVGQNSCLRCFYLSRNRLLFAWRNRTGCSRIFAIIYQLLIANPKNIFIYAIKGQIDLIMACLKGIISFITMKNKKE